MNEQQIAQCFDGILEIQKHLVGMTAAVPGIGERIIKSENFQRFSIGRSDLFTLKLNATETKAAIIGTGAVNDPLVSSFKPAIDSGKRRAIRIRDLLTVAPTENGAIEMPIKDSATIGSPAIQNRENTTLGESAYTFTDSFIPCQTIGHFVPVSKQTFEDAGTFDAFINQEMFHGLRQKEQDQLLNGDGTGSSLTGLLDNATAWSNESPNITNEVDIIRSAIKQIELADFAATAIVLNPVDWYDIDTRKAGTSDDTYAAGDPRTITGDRLWGLPVVSTNAIAAGTFLVGDFNQAAVLFDRQEAEIQIARHDDTNFQKNMLTIRALERLALVITNATALVTGSL